MLLKRRREEFASVQRQLLHFQEDSATDERKQIKEETFAREKLQHSLQSIYTLLFLRFIDQFK